MGNRAAVSSSTSQVCSNTASGLACAKRIRQNPANRPRLAAGARKGLQLSPLSAGMVRTLFRIIADRPPLSRGGRQPQLTAEDLAAVEPVSSCTFTGWDTAFSISAWSTASGCTFTGNRFRFNCTDGTPGHSLYNENTFEYNGIAVLLKSVPSDPTPDFQNSVFPGNDTDIRLSPGGWAHRESPGVRPGILSKSRLVFYGTLPNFL